MPRFGIKALLTALSLNKSRSQRPNWDRTILVLSTTVTLGLIALFIYGKATSRW
ncbi:MAG TPA: hypothetical protein VNY08_19015 [Bradyrhizobium sp.]|jgi:hypothetical protein|nr:hypothetical protein [Bradyrhizobium sp.]